MSGDIDDDTLAQIATGRLVKRSFVLMVPDEGPMGFWDDHGDVSIGGVTYKGTGKVGSIGVLPSTTDMSMPNVQVVLNGVDDDVVAAFYALTWHLRPITVSHRLFDGGLRNVFASPLGQYKGLMDKAPRTGGDKKPGALTISIEDAMRRSTLNSLAVRNDGDQRTRLSTDGLFQYVSTVGQSEVYWGKRQPKIAKNPPTIHGLPATKK